MCWHCDRMLDAATELADEGATAHPGAISLCLYCGAIAVFADDLRLEPCPEELLSKLVEDSDFRKSFVNFNWARQYVMIKENLMRDHDDPDR
jgi:hypothetical protein